MFAQCNKLGHKKLEHKVCLMKCQQFLRLFIAYDGKPFKIVISLLVHKLKFF
jgi:ribosomal protein L32